MLPAASRHQQLGRVGPHTCVLGSPGPHGRPAPPEAITWMEGEEADILLGLRSCASAPFPVSAFGAIEPSRDRVVAALDVGQRVPCLLIMCLLSWEVLQYWGVYTLEEKAQQLCAKGGLESCGRCEPSHCQRPTQGLL